MPKRFEISNNGHLLYLSAVSYSDEEPIKPPPPKRTKYVPSRIKTEPHTDCRHRRDDPNATFDVCVGESQRIFTLNEDTFTQRSKFLRNAREQAKRWWRRNKANLLADEDPEMFAAYVHTVCFGVDDLKKRIESDRVVDRGFRRTSTDDEDKTEKHLDAKKTKTARFLVDLWLLSANKLLDPGTSNLVIDVLAAALDDVELDVGVLFAITPHVYASTAAGSRLRMLVRDVFMHDMWASSWAEDAQASGMPYELLQDYAIEICRLQTNNDSEGRIERVFDDFLEYRREGYYHIY
jgi:hypothetical protein